LEKGCVQKLKKKSYISCFLVLVLLLLIVIPAIAAENFRFEHSARYELDGRISIGKRYGDPCFTGAYKRQSITGYGEFTKLEEVKMASHIISIKDKMDWKTAEDAVQNLTVMSTIELCARPMSTAADDYAAEHVYNDEVIPLLEYNIKKGDVLSPYHPLVVEGLLEVNPETEQVWSTFISSEPGHVGAYHSDLVAAYGPGPYDTNIYDQAYRWWYDDDNLESIAFGDRYVGNYFELDQYILTTSGETRRFISISSPFSNTYIEESFSVTGMAEVTETFSLDNIEHGTDAVILAWYEFF